MTDSNGRKMVDIEVDKSWFPDLMVASATYEDDGSDVPVEELENIDNDDIALYIAGV